uniref:Beta-1,3-glucosyltransferase n=1 Tax=Plectus sambesii TaxID=2011161 RepID=A0A914W5A9_9BILA
MENVSSFCTTNVEDESCITKYLPSYSNCGHEVSENDVYFAVKTFSGYHKDRIVVVKRTWSKSANHIEYFSDIEDHFVPTVNIGIENTERGHCGKTFAIFKRFLEHEELQSLDLAWLAVVDDDTLLSVPRLFKLLSCYDSSKPLIVGERYGYGFTTEGQGGYDYPTGGSGMFFTRPAVQAIIDSCQCPSNDAPDDMIIGMCARRQEIPVLHSAAFHQARPDDYAEDYLNRLPPISFHKHTDVDPYKVYTDYLVERETEPEVHHHRHTEL